ncbi:MAG: DUF3267 domain-containing protein [Lachnospiraceae bacterium]
MSVESLPDNYKLECCISMEKNLKLTVGLNIGGLLLLIPFIIGMFFLLPKGEFSFTIGFFPLILLCAGIVFILLLHELVHGFFFKVYSKGKVRYGFKRFYAYACSPDYYFRKNEYIIIGLAPFIILNLLMVLMLLFVKGALFYVLYIILAVHFVGCIGDLYVVIKLIKYKPETLIRDTGDKMEFYTQTI